MPYYPSIPSGPGGAGVTLLPYLTGVTLSPKGQTQNSGTTRQITAVGTLSGASGISSGSLSQSFLSWSSSDTSYATVNQNGLVNIISGSVAGTVVYISASMLGDVTGITYFTATIPSTAVQYLISETGSTNVLTHIYVSSSGLVDTKGLTWSVAGTPYIVNATGRTPSTIGYYTGSYTTNYIYSTASNAQRPTGNFNATIVLSSSVGRNGDVAGWNSTGGGNYYLYATTNNMQYQDGGNLNDNTSATWSGITVISFGRSGSTQYMKINRRNTVSVAAGTPAAETTVYIGRGTANGQQWDAPIYEFFLSSDAWDETAIAARNSATLAFFGL